MSGVNSTRSRMARCAPHAVRLKISSLSHKKNAKKPAAKYKLFASAANTAKLASESPLGRPIFISFNAPKANGATNINAPIAAGICATCGCNPSRLPIQLVSSNVPPARAIKSLRSSRSPPCERSRREEVAVIVLVGLIGNVSFRWVTTSKSTLYFLKVKA